MVAWSGSWVARRVPGRCRLGGVAVGGHRTAGGTQVEVGQASGVAASGRRAVEAELSHAGGREGAVMAIKLVRVRASSSSVAPVHDAVLNDHVVQAKQTGMVEGGGGPGLGRDPVPEVGLAPLTGVRSGREAELLDGELAAAWLGGPPDDAAPRAAQWGVQRPAACDEPPADVL